MSESISEVTTLPSFGVRFTPTEIVINGKKELEQAVKQYADKYKDIAVTSATESDSKKILAELRKTSSELDNKRKLVKREYQEPLLDFESDIKAMQSQLSAVIEPIDTGIKELTEQHRNERKQEVIYLISEMAPNYGVKESDIEIDPTWLNKTTSKKKILDGIAGEMTQLKHQHDELDKSKLVVSQYAKAKGIEPDGWIEQVNQGNEIDYIFKQIDNAVSKREIERKNQEIQAAVDTANQQIVNNKIIDTETGTIVSRSVNLKITTTLKNMNLLKEYMDKLGIIYQKIQED